MLFSSLTGFSLQIYMYLYIYVYNLQSSRTKYCSNATPPGRRSLAAGGSGPVGGRNSARPSVNRGLTAGKFSSRAPENVPQQRL